VDIHHLVKMANEIANFFESQSDRAGAEEAIASHIKRFWDPRMRKQIIEWVDAGDTDGMKPLVADAIRSQRALLLPPPRPA
jgi:formate dehydrogenase subunit delta